MGILCMLKIICAILIIGIWIASIYALIDRCDRKNIPGNWVIIFIISCPIINTIVAMYISCKYNNWKHSLKLLFGND